MSSMNDILKAVQKHEVEVANNAIDKLVEEIHKVLTDKDSDLLEGLEEHLGDIVTSVKENLKEDSKKAAKVAAGKKVKDPNAPKRPPSKYNLFIQAQMETLKEAHKDKKPTELMKMAVAAWNQHKALVGGHHDDDENLISGSDHESETEVKHEEVELKKKPAPAKKAASKAK